MNLRRWSQSEVKYGQEVLSRGLEGARSGREAFLHGQSFTPYFLESSRRALMPAVIGTCIGVAGSYPRNGHRSAGRVLRFGLLGGLIGFCAGFVWENRRLSASVVSGACRNIGKVRDEHWLERHPIDYA